MEDAFYSNTDEPLSAAARARAIMTLNRRKGAINTEMGVLRPFADWIEENGKDDLITEQLAIEYLDWVSTRPLLNTNGTVKAGAAILSASSLKKIITMIGRARRAQVDSAASQGIDLDKEAPFPRGTLSTTGSMHPAPSSAKKKKQSSSPRPRKERAAQPKRPRGPQKPRPRKTTTLAAPGSTALARARLDATSAGATAPEESAGALASLSTTDFEDIERAFDDNGDADGLDTDETESTIGESGKTTPAFVLPRNVSRLMRMEDAFYSNT
ncbi:hypothetical protein JCM6882_009372, partial [Rhodosporidiobolus microsporus]